MLTVDVHGAFLSLYSEYMHSDQETAPSTSSSDSSIADEEEQLVQLLTELTIQRDETLQRLVQVRQRREQPRRRAAPASDATPLPGVFQPGDYVYIDNQLGATHVNGRTATEADRAAVVTRVDQVTERIYFRTFNGYDTWRSPNNLHHISPESAERIRQQAE